MTKKIVVWHDTAENDLRKELSDYIDEILSSGEESNEEDDDDDALSQGSGSLWGWGDADTVKQKPTSIYELNNFFKFKYKKKSCLSPSFYADRYHMCLRVHPNGYGKGEGSHVSVYVCLLQGVYDRMVSWPFRGEVIIELLHNSNGQPHRRVVKYGHDTPIDFSTVAKGPAKGNGCPKFISNRKLNSYRVSGTLRFHIYVMC
ncbi:PREDICTED: TNF receptor-associated factor 1-like [Amphimedon queenslandica]|uniref:MATH domain-containing protein n=1 Tax=Amphimedon queenslandica TaxID=400682 RepID=A0A1X7SRH1_AMPQE|nr:PREDICTED: TNF receptor-associated factor 1-like [Amphimedon queenslandica]|eukprot:XP_011408961.1 PREDICTED: TNF receptor-associated factor 1-like [Amphimedon queenslandica]